MPSFANSVTNTPPPSFANAAPYELVVGVVTTQPSFPFAAVEQSVEFTSVLVCSASDACVHPSLVCSAIWFIVTWFTPSNVSICAGQRGAAGGRGRRTSPPLGQSAADDQKDRKSVV